MTALAVALKTVRETAREPQLLGVTLAVPALLIAIYYVAFAQTDAGMAKFLHLLVVDDDTGVEMPDGSTWSAGAELVDELRALRFDERPVFAIRAIETPADAAIDLRERRATLLLHIPEGFTRALIDARLGKPFALPATVIAEGDGTSDHVVLATSVLEDLLRAFGGSLPRWGQEPRVRYEPLDASDTVTDFEFGAAGVIVFGTLFLVVTTATAVVRERTAGTLRRLRMARIGAGSLMGGIALGQLAFAVAQVALVFAVAYAFGLRPQGSLALAGGVAMLCSVAAIGVGLLVACVSRTDVDAVTLGAATSVPLAFLSGSLMPMPALRVGELAGHGVGAFDWLATTHGVEAMRRILLHGDGVGALGYELTGLALLALLTLGLGLALFPRLGMRTD